MLGYVSSVGIRVQNKMQYLSRGVYRRKKSQAHERDMDHNRYAANPGKYPDEALSQHYDTFHPGMSPDLVFSILDKELSTVKRKIKEAFYISNEKPSINKKDECVVLERFLVKH